MKNHQSIAVVNFSALSRCEQPVPVIGNYRMDVRKINVEDSIFPLPTEYNNKTEYASIAQAAERILGKNTFFIYPYVCFACTV